jgi:hypothetical protein
VEERVGERRVLKKAKAIFKSYLLSPTLSSTKSVEERAARNKKVF